MKTIQKKSKARFPNWQINRMKSIIESRWDEVWKIVIKREQYLNRLDSHQHNKNF